MVSFVAVCFVQYRRPDDDGQNDDTGRRSSDKRDLATVNTFSPTTTRWRTFVTFSVFWKIFQKSGTKNFKEVSKA